MKRIACIVFALLFCALPLSASAAAPAGPAVAEVDIGIAPEYYEKLVTESEKTPYPALAVWNGDAFEVQINIRGNTSKRLGLSAETKRIPFEIKRGQKVPICEALGNHDVKFVNSLTPYQLLAEYIALELFAWMGVPTPAHALSFVQFNGVDFGTYLAVEDLNGTFLRKHYADPSGVLLKNTSDMNKPKGYVNSEWFGALFEKEGKNDPNIDAFLAALDRGEGYEAFINEDEWLRFFACVAAIGGGDSIFTMMNSFAMYDNGGRFELIPWDQSAFLAESPNGIDRFYVGNDPKNPSRLFDLLMQNDDLKTKYHGYIRRIAEEFLAKERMDERFGALLDAVSPYLPRDHSILLNRDTVLDDLMAAAPDDPLNLRYSIEKTRENLLAQLRGDETVFYVNEAYMKLRIAQTTISDVLRGFETDSIDHQLPQKILQAYPAWQKAHAGQTGRVIWGVLPCAAAALIGAAVAVIAAKKKKKKA